MSLGAFLTDESREHRTRAALSLILTMSQKWALGLMRWRICRFVSVYDHWPRVSLLMRFMTAGMSFRIPSTRTWMLVRDVRILTIVDSRTSYGTERRTYSSTTGAYGGSSMGGKTLKAFQLVNPRLSRLMVPSLQVTLSARNFHSPKSHPTLSTLEISRLMLLTETSPTSLPAAKSQTFELLRTKSSTSRRDLDMQSSLHWKD